MTYQVAYGTDTDSLEDPSQLVLVTLPDEASMFDNDGLIWHIKDNWADLDTEPLVGINDVIESLWLLLKAEGVDDNFIRRVIDGLTDAIDNNS